MAQLNELKKIKRLYGEKFSRLCRELFPQILENEGQLLKILLEIFSKNCNTLYESIDENNLVEDFKNLIYSVFDNEKENKKEKIETRTPYEILDEAGYDLHDCLTEDEIHKYIRYYENKEVLCTIYNGGRLDTRFCFWAVRKDADKIKRENFKNPKKDYKYSTSVLAIQFDKQPNSRVEIISRYNHTVPNPNCTLDNNLDNIAEGLQRSFAQVLEERGVLLYNKTKADYFEIPGYTLAIDGKYYKYNYEIDGDYYCPGNIVIKKGRATEIGNPEEIILCDYFIIDLKNKKIKSLFEGVYQDSFVDDLTDIEKIEVKKDKEKNVKYVIIHKSKTNVKDDCSEPIVIELDNDNRIIGYTNKNVQNIEDMFLYYNEKVQEINLPQVKRVGHHFMEYNVKLVELSMPQIESIGNSFMPWNEKLEYMNMPKLQEIGDEFLFSNTSLTSLDLPQVQKIGNDFLSYNSDLEELNMPQLQFIENGFLYNNMALKKVDMPKVLTIGNCFMRKNTSLIELNIPHVKKIGAYFLPDNQALTELNMPFNQYFKTVTILKKQTPGEILKDWIILMGKKFGNVIKKICPKDALKNALSQGITMEQVNQANIVENQIQEEKFEDEETLKDR